MFWRKKPASPESNQKHVNLISNARYAVEQISGPRRLTIRIHLAEKQGFLQIQISDNGVGIKPEDRSRIFTQGFTTRKGGHGFGLYSSALAAKIMGGSLSVSSHGEGQGATFTLELPAISVEAHV